MMRKERNLRQGTEPDRQDEYRCRYCEERFPSITDRDRHEEEMHVEEREESETVWQRQR